MNSQYNFRYNIDRSTWAPHNIIDRVCELEMQHQCKNIEEQLLFRIEMWIELSRVQRNESTNQERKMSSRDRKISLQESRAITNSFPSKLSNRKLSKSSIFSSSSNLSRNSEDKDVKTVSRSADDLNKNFGNEVNETTIRKSNSRWKNFFYHNDMKKRKHSYDNDLIVKSDRDTSNEFLNQIQSIQEMHLGSSKNINKHKNNVHESDTVAVSSRRDSNNSNYERYQYQQQIILF